MNISRMVKLVQNTGRTVWMEIMVNSEPSKNY
jgi:hypothetical protein